MHEAQQEVTADRSKHAPARTSEPPAVRALTVRTERRTERHADVLVLWLGGALDHSTSALLDREFDAQARHASHLVVDLTGLDLIDPGGLETLVRTRRRATENDQRTSFRQGPHVGRLPRELTHDAHRRFPPAARRADDTRTLAIVTRDVPVGDDVDRLGDDALLSYLTDAAAQREMRLVIEQRSGECVAESRAPSGLGGEMVILGANGPTRRRAMLGLARLFGNGCLSQGDAASKELK